MTIFGVTMVNSDGLDFEGRETETIIGINNFEVLQEAYQAYENAYTEYEDLIDDDTTFLDALHFQTFLSRGEVVLIQCIDKHIQFEPWKKEV